MEEGKVGKAVAANSEVLLDLALVDVEKGELVGAPHPLLLAFLGPLKVKGIQLDVSVAGEHEESPGLGLASVVKPR